MPRDCDKSTPTGAHMMCLTTHSEVKVEDECSRFYNNTAYVLHGTPCYMDPSTALYVFPSLTRVLPRDPRTADITRPTAWATSCAPQLS